MDENWVVEDVSWVEDVLDGGLVGWTKCEVLGMRLGLLFRDWTCSSFGLCW